MSISRAMVDALSSGLGARTFHERKSDCIATASWRSSVPSSLAAKPSRRSIASTSVCSNTAIVPEGRTVGTSSLGTGLEG